MKKTMFITSVIMVVVMAIALTTSSLAWFTAAGATTVNVNTVTVSAKAESSQGLLIANNISDWQTGTLTLSSPTGTDLYPVVPCGKGYSNTDTGIDAAMGSGYTADDAKAAFVLALQKSQFVGNSTKVEGGVTKFASDYTTASTKYYETTLYVANSGDAAIAVSAAITIPALTAHGATMHVAVLAVKETYVENDLSVTAANETYYELLAYAKSSETYATKLGRYADSNSDTTNDFFAADAQESLACVDVTPVPQAKTSFNLGGTQLVDSGSGVYVQEPFGDWMKVKVLAWYAQDLSNSNSGAYDADSNATGSTASFTIQFTKQTANA